MARLNAPAPPFQVERWLNAPDDFSVDQVRGRVIAALAFQMLCPGCVSHALPQLQRLRETFDPAEVAVVGLHTVFEHHEAQGGAAPLQAFLSEYRITCPVGLDTPSPEGGPPLTMRAYAMQGTPTLLLIDRAGRLRAQVFGHVPDLKLGAVMAGLVSEEAPAA